MSTTINDVLPREQAIATNLQTVFNVNFTADEDTDVRVYARATGVDADDVSQIVSDADYTVTFVGGDRLIRVTFNVGRTTGDVITISRETPTDRMNLYTNTNFTPSMLNQDFEVTVLDAQQNKMFRDALGPRYNVSASIGTEAGGSATATTDLILPKLLANYAWVMNSTATAISGYELPENGAAPAEDTYWTKVAETDLPNSVDLAQFATGFVQSTTATGEPLTRVITGTAGEIDVANGDGAAANPTVSISSNATVPGSAKLTIPAGTTAQRPGSPTTGDIRFNTDLVDFEFYDGSVWRQTPLSVSSTDNAVVRFDGTAGQLQNSGVIISDTNSVTGVLDLEVGGVFRQGTTATPVKGSFISLTSQPWLNITSNMTDASPKDGGIVTPHYTNTEEPMAVIMGSAKSIDNVVRIGGGNANINASTQIAFYSAMNTTTVTGTEVVRVTYNGFRINSGKAILDSNDNELITFSHMASAVNEIDIANSATGDPVTIKASGDDTNIDLNIHAKGTGNILFDNYGVVCGDPGTEQSGININGVTYESLLKVSDIGTSNAAQMIVHRHSTTLEPLVVGARSNSDTSAHAIVTNGQSLFSIYGTGWDGASYQLGAQISMEVDGTPGLNDMPGRIVFKTTPDGAKVPVEALRIKEDKTSLFSGDLEIASGVSGVLDANSNELLTFSQTASAVNNVNVSNAATGNKPVYSVVGDDTNIGAIFNTKGTGKMLFNATTEPTKGGYLFQHSEGMINVTDNMTDANSKVGMYLVPHYTNAEEGVTLIRGDCSLASNKVTIGGGSANANAATAIRMFAAANTTTTTGTEILRINPNGLSLDAGSNFLSAYKSGSWNPTPYGSTTAGSPSGTFTGSYLYTSDWCWVSAEITFTNLDTMAGDLILGSLPIAVASGAQNRGSAVITLRGNFTNDFAMGVYFNDGSTDAKLRRIDIDGSDVAISDLSATSTFFFSGGYPL